MNKYHLFALHYVFMPRLNKSMESFVKSWNNHSLRTEHGHSPNQLFTAGVFLSQGSSSSELFDTEAIDEATYGVEEAGVVGSDEDITVPKMRIVLSVQQEDSLQQALNPLLPTKFRLHKSFYAVSPDPYLSEALGKGSDCVRLNMSCVVATIFSSLAVLSSFISMANLSRLEAASFSSLALLYSSISMANLSCLLVTTFSSLRFLSNSHHCLLHLA